MKYILCFIGFVFCKLRSFVFKMISLYNTNSVNNKGGVISGQTIIAYPRNIYIGKNSYVNGGQLKAGKNSKIIIGDNTIISYNVHIRANTHIYDSIDIPIKNQGEVDKGIEIGDDCWIGYGAQIMPGVKIGSHVIVGAGAVVTHDVKDYDIVGGVPARVIRNRKSRKK